MKDGDFSVKDGNGPPQTGERFFWKSRKEGFLQTYLDISKRQDYNMANKELVALLIIQKF